MPTLSSLIQKRKWDQVSELLLKNADNAPCNFECCYDHIVLASDICLCNNILHHALDYKPPVSIVRTITEIFPEAANEVDCMLRYPLHIALMNGLSADVIRHLIKVNEKAVSSTDAEGKTALHLLFSDYKVRRKCDRTHFKEAMQSLPEIIYIICQHDPKLMFKEDLNKMSVLEYAMQEEVDYETLSLLQGVAESAKKGKDFSSFVSRTPYNKTNNEGSIRRASQVGKAMKAGSTRRVSQVGKIMKAVKKSITSSTA